MKILVTGADGFIGRSVSETLKDDELYRAVSKPKNEGEYGVNLESQKSTLKLIAATRPDVVINCAGIVENSEKAELNVTFTKNILDACMQVDSGVKKVIVLGSAAEYGNLQESDMPVNEDTARIPTSPYGAAKKKEIDTALSYNQNSELQVVVARLFNPIGAGMKPRFLIPELLRQLEGIKEGKTNKIEVSRLDSRRDYLDVKDVARALALLSKSEASFDTYNIGSGISTTNEELLKICMEVLGFSRLPQITESNPEPEKPVASQADIKRISTDIGWNPEIDLKQSIKEIINEYK